MSDRTSGQRSKAFCPHELAVSCDVHAIFTLPMSLRFTTLPLAIVFSTPQLYKVVEILLNDGSGYFLNAGTIIVDISPPARKHPLSLDDYPTQYRYFYIPTHF